MRIALVCPFNMFDRPGGVPQVVMHIYEGLKKNGHYVKIITQRPSSFSGKASEDYILMGITRTFKGGLGTEGNWGMPADSEEMNEILKREKFDVINFHEPWIPMLAWQMVRYSQAAHVATFHANLMDTAAGKSWTILRPYGVPLLKKMDIFTATSSASAGMIITRADMRSSKQRQLIENLRYIPCGVDLNVYKPLKTRTPLHGPDTKTIVYVGRLEKRKGTDWLIKAFAELVKEMPNAYLIIAGRGLWSQKLRDYVRNNNIPNITFPGYITDEEKSRLLGNADLACFPSPYGEGFGIVLLESMAMGTPVIAGNNLGYSNVLKGHGRLGLVDPQATADFSNRLAAFLTDDVLQRSMRSWGLKEVRQYDYPKIVRQYETVYKDAIQLKNKSKAAQKRHGKKTESKRRFSFRR
jgi:phosphatidylinositol alpha-mannosyltransferase